MTNDIRKVGPSIEQEFQKVLEQGLDNGYEELMESELTFKPKDKIIYFLFEGFCNGLQEITLENYEGDDLDNSEFFISNSQEIGLGCYFYLPDEKEALKKYISYDYSDWIFPVDEAFIKEILLNDKNLILVKTKNLEFKFPESWAETYGDIYKLNSGKYTRLDGDYSYDFGYDEKGGMYSTNLLVKVLYVDCQTRENFKIIDLGTDYKSKLKELDLI